MLEVRNLTKIYKTKGAEDFVALNNVSVSFNSTGMVFLLGKSGSGKSTLLNVLGGLDKFESGEIVIKGKSSKDFTQRDFDSYRNTYLGFVFQEYNILPEFTVYKNIALALELQGKKATREKVMELLKSVDLQNLAKRKPNQLSGGQKQRIAIARALIKSPEIILADEPTGALDSATGKQVFDTLKKLSQNKLVIVVSHDREFAEQYADRIIELKDGQIISDVTKRKKPPKDVSGGVRVIGKNILHIKKGHKLTPRETELINQLLEVTEDGIYMTADNKTNKELKKVAKIDDLGNNEYFDETKETDKEKTKSTDTLHLIKSRLKFKDSFKMGASGLKHKKIRLFFTIFLSAIALTLFGLSDTMASFNIAQCNYDSLMKLNIPSISIQKQEEIKYDDYSYVDNTNSDDSDVEYFKNTYKNHSFVPVIDYSYSYTNFTSENINSMSYYMQSSDGVVSMTSNELKQFGMKVSSGRLPNSIYEIALTEYQVEIFVKHGIRGQGNITRQNIVGKKLSLGENELTIVGIVDTKFNASSYEELKLETSGSSFNYILYSQFYEYISSGFHNIIFISKEADKYLSSQLNISYADYTDFIVGKNASSSDMSEYYSYNRYFSTNGDDILQGTVFFDSSKTSLAPNEVIINQYTGIDGRSPFSAYKYSNTYYTFQNDTYDSESSLISAIRNYYNTNYSGSRLNCVIRNANRGDSSYTFDTTYKVVGVYYNFLMNNESVSRDILFFKNTQSAPTVLKSNFARYSLINTNLTGDDRALIEALSNYTSTSATYVIKSEISSMLKNFSTIIVTLAQVFMYISIGFAVFSALLLMNFISSSISYKKKEIGILRALGARGSDVYGIFFNESFIITTINYIISLILTIAGVVLLNNLVFTGAGLKLALLSFGIRQIGLLLLVSFAVAVISTFLPTYRISKMKPIDAIHERK